MFRKFADKLAVILHPVFLSFLVLLLMNTLVLLGVCGEGFHLFLYASFSALFFQVGIPLSIVYFKKWNSFNLTRKKRVTLLMLTFVSYAALLTVFILLPEIYLREFVVFCLLDILFLFFLNLIFKVSLHANAAGIVFYFTIIGLLKGIYGNILGLPVFQIVAFPLSFCLLVVLWQRFASRSHSVTEILLGLLSGITISFVVTYWNLPAKVLDLFYSGLHIHT